MLRFLQKPFARTTSAVVTKLLQAPMSTSRKTVGGRGAFRRQASAVRAAPQAIACLEDFRG
jgi:hypothetical protein